LAHRLARNPREDAGDRFRPHLTLCRYRKDGRAERFGESIPVEGISFGINRVRLMSSVLRSEGAVHREERAWTLA
jgi:2'-5' RNA ligase